MYTIRVDYFTFKHGKPYKSCVIVKSDTLDEDELVKIGKVRAAKEEGLLQKDIKILSFSELD